MPSLFERVDEYTLFALAVAAFLVTIEVAFALGRRRREKGGEVGKINFTTTQTAALGLLALLLGFNFSLAASRFDARKALLQDEVDAIDVVYWRAQFLPPQVASQIDDRLRAYVDTRLEFMKRGFDIERIDAADHAGSQIVKQLWMQAQALPDGQEKWFFIQALNDLVLTKLKRRGMLDNHVPEPILHLLFLMSLGALGYLAYGFGLMREQGHRSIIVFALLIAMVLTAMLDMDRPRRGIIHIPETPMLRLQGKLAQNQPE